MPWIVKVQVNRVDINLVANGLRFSCEMGVIFAGNSPGDG